MTKLTKTRARTLTVGAAIATAALTLVALAVNWSEDKGDMLTAEDGGVVVGGIDSEVSVGRDLNISTYDRDKDLKQGAIETLNTAYSDCLTQVDRLEPMGLGTFATLQIPALHSYINPNDYIRLLGQEKYQEANKYYEQQVHMSLSAVSYEAMNIQLAGAGLDQALLNPENHAELMKDKEYREAYEMRTNSQKLIESSGKEIYGDDYSLDFSENIPEGRMERAEFSKQRFLKIHRKYCEFFSASLLDSQ